MAKTVYLPIEAFKLMQINPPDFEMDVTNFLDNLERVYCGHIRCDNVRCANCVLDGAGRDHLHKEVNIEVKR